MYFDCEDYDVNIAIPREVYTFKGQIIFSGNHESLVIAYKMLNHAKWEDRKTERKKLKVAHSINSPRW